MKSNNINEQSGAVGNCGKKHQYFWFMHKWCTKSMPAPYGCHVACETAYLTQGKYIPCLKNKKCHN